jgi:hypothetical protein
MMIQQVHYENIDSALMRIENIAAGGAANLRQRMRELDAAVAMPRVWIERGVKCSIWRGDQ